MVGVPSVVRAGGLTIAVGTGGAAPALARRVREKLAAEFDATFAEWVKLLEEVRPLVLAAHMDHPGFEVVRSLGEARWVAQFNGGVPDDYFREGTRLRLLPGSTAATCSTRQATSRTASRA